MHTVCYFTIIGTLYSNAEQTWSFRGVYVRRNVSFVSCCVWFDRKCQVVEYWSFMTITIDLIISNKMLSSIQKKISLKCIVKSHQNITEDWIRTGELYDISTWDRITKKKPKNLFVLVDFGNKILDLSMETLETWH